MPVLPGGPTVGEAEARMRTQTVTALVVCEARAWRLGVGPPGRTPHAATAPKARSTGTTADNTE